MKSLFQSRVFKRLFFAYLKVILISMFLYITFLLYSHHQIKQFQVDRGAEIQADEAGLILDRYMMNAQNIVQNISYSPVMKDLYMSCKIGSILDPYKLYMIQTELKNTMIQGDLSVYKTVIFLDNKDVAYSSGGMINLAEKFSGNVIGEPCLIRGTLNEIFGIDSKRYSFLNECIVYHDGYRFQDGNSIGTVVVLFDINYLTTELSKILSEGYGVTILCDGEELVSVGEKSGKIHEVPVRENDEILIRVYTSDAVPADRDIMFISFLILAVLIFASFIFLAYKTSVNYYSPIDHINTIVNGSPSEDEMEGIITGIRQLIGEKNVYREKMLTISPYIKQGVLHSAMTGNLMEENIQILSDENYFDLIKPFYMVSVVNLAPSIELASNEKDSLENMEDIFKVMVENFSTDEISVVYYLQDNNHIFIIINSDNENIEDDLFFYIHKHLQVAFEKQKIVVTLGVDRLREDINELQEACDGAMKALDGILTDGRGEVYFLEERSGDVTSHYFPEKFKEKIIKYIDKGQKREIHELLQDIYERNWKLGGAPEMYRALIDELHLSIIKALREATQLNMTHANIEKFSALATLKEVFDYYDAALASIVDSISQEEAVSGDSELFEEEILRYIDDNAFNPELSLQSISDKFKVSNKYLSLLCKKNFGMTYLSYIQAKRINRAAELLEKGEHSLSDVALMCGYTNQLTFRRNFKSIKGINPSDFE